MKIKSMEVKSCVEIEFSAGQYGDMQYRRFSNGDWEELTHDGWSSIWIGSDHGARTIGELEALYQERMGE